MPLKNAFVESKLDQAKTPAPILESPAIGAGVSISGFKRR